MEKLEEQLTLGEDEHAARLRRALDAAFRQLVTLVDRPMFRVFFSKVKPVSFDGSAVTLGVANELDRNWLSSRYGRMIAGALSEQMGQAVTVEFALIESDSHAAPPSDAEVFNPVPPPQVKEPLAALPPLVLTERFTFANFIVGPTNCLAHAGARAVADQPGAKYNPLFIFGGVGLGKTHLLHAIGLEAASANPRLRIVCMNGETFTDRYVTCARDGSINAFRRLHRSVDLWLIDDVQFIAGKERTQEEFFHTFNALHQAGRQIVLCSDRPPRDLYLIDEKLRSRFEQGLVADLASPDPETRAAILLEKARAEHFSIPMDVVHYISDKIQSNIRALEGALTRLMTQVSLTDQPVTIALAAKVLSAFFIEPQPHKIAVSIESIQKACCKQFGIDLADMIGTCRQAKIVRARQIAMYLSREHTSFAWKAIGRYFGNRDHSTVMHAHRAIAGLLANDSHVEHEIHEVMRKVHLH